MEEAAKSLNGAWVEEKEYSIAFHFRGANAPDTPERVRRLMEQLQALAHGHELHIVDGKKIVEARVAAINKGFAMQQWIRRGLRTPGFILAIGDDTTDEDLFAAMPAKAFTVKVGHHRSLARSSVESPAEVLELLADLAAA